MKKKCRGCKKEKEMRKFDFGDDTCTECKQKAYPRSSSNDDSGFDAGRFAMNVALGDVCQTGIPGGIDFDITTPL